MVTTITDIKSNINGTLALALSKWKPNSGRVISLKNNKCIGEWPNQKTNIQFGNVGSFGDNNWFSVGSSNGYINVFNFELSWKHLLQSNTFACFIYSLLLVFIDFIAFCKYILNIYAIRSHGIWYHLKTILAVFKKYF